MKLVVILISLFLLLSCGGRRADATINIVELHDFSSSIAIIPIEGVISEEPGVVVGIFGNQRIPSMVEFVISALYNA